MVSQKKWRITCKSIRRTGGGLLIGRIQEFEIGLGPMWIRRFDQDGHCARQVSLLLEGCGQGEGRSGRRFFGWLCGEKGPPAGGVGVAASQRVVPGYETGLLERGTRTRRGKEVGRS